MFFQHIFDASLAQASYLVGCQRTGEAIVIDPKRDVDTYLDIAKQNGLRITHVTETHIHADFLSGSRELAALTEATLYLSNEGGPDWQYQFAHKGLTNGDVIRVGNLTLDVIHTPGHTPESISFLLTDKPASAEPVVCLVAPAWLGHPVVKALGAAPQVRLREANVEHVSFLFPAKKTAFLLLGGGSALLVQIIQARFVRAAGGLLALQRT